MVWAPDGFPEGSAWGCLLDNFLGVFQATPRPEMGESLLVDLWSGQALRWRPEEEDPALDEHTLVIGRFVLGPEGRHEALPGVYSCAAPGLVNAIERDLNAWRAENPRSRLSQLECERLFAPLLAAGDPAGEGRRPAGRVRQELDQLLAGVPGWSGSGMENALAMFGPEEVLNRLAFESSVDLEQARRLLFELATEAKGGQETQELEHGPQELPAGCSQGVGDSAAALRRFDQARAEGTKLEDSFRQLEEDLGLGAGVSLEQEDGSAVGPARPATFLELLASYRWEREASGEPLDAAEGGLLEQLGRFLEAIRRPGQASCLQPDQILAYLLQAGDLAAFRQQRSGLGPFLDWCSREQDEPVASLHRALLEDLGRRLEQAVACNLELAGTGEGAAGFARVAATEPLQVEAGNSEQVPVTGIPDRFLALIRVPDLLRGSWHGGRFEAAAWIPAEACGRPAAD